MIDGLLMGSVYALNAVGLNLIVGVVGLINFAYSDFMMIAMFTSYWMYFLLAIDPVFSIPVAMLVGALLGWFTYTFITKRVLHAPSLAQTLSTFALGIFIRNLAVLLFTQNYHIVNNSLVSGQIYLGSALTVSTPKLFAACISLLCSGLLWVILKKTKMGLALRATANNKDAAALMGMNPNKMFCTAFMVGCGCVGIAGAVLINFYYVYPYVGANFSTLSFITIALGGFGNILGAFAAGLIVGVAESVSGFLVDSSLKYAVVFLVFLVIMVLRQQGVKGKN